jgi:hypothetical protein
VFSLPLLRYRPIFRCAVLSAIAGFSVFPAGCVPGPPYYGPPPYYHYHPSVYDYYYYPRAQVYFQFTTGIYYYRDGGVWVTSRILPPHIHLDASERVRIQAQPERPYLKFNEHNRIYKPQPNYRMDLEQSRKEREANQRWYQEYEKRYPRDSKKRGGIQ